MEAIAIRLEAIATRVEAIATRVEAIIASRLTSLLQVGWRPSLLGKDSKKDTRLCHVELDCTMLLCWDQTVRRGALA